MNIQKLRIWKQEIVREVKKEPMLFLAIATVVVACLLAMAEKLTALSLSR